MKTELVFKALGDANRRKILDMLEQRDGRSLTDIESQFEMTRFGVMKHLRILVEAGLVVTRKQGRETLHYLNTVPIQEVYDRWVSKYSARWAVALTGLKQQLEANEMEDSANEQTEHVFVVLIKTTPGKLWQALTDGTLTAQYYFGTRVESDWRAGSPYRNLDAGGNPLLEGVVIECDPPRRLVMTFNPKWAPVEVAESRVAYEIEVVGDVCKLTLVHSGLLKAHPMTAEFFGGWSQILSGLKTLLETGEPLMAARG